MNTDFKYLVIEDSYKVCEGIKERMDVFKNWSACKFAHHVDDAKQILSDTRPEMIFMDWSLRGGSAFEVLEHMRTIPGFYPYIIFNTGYQSDNPEIPQEIINRYRVDKYLVKPFWEKLTLYLETYVDEAERKFAEKKIEPIIFIADITKEKKYINLSEVICVCKDGLDFSKKILYLRKGKQVVLKITWPKLLFILDENKTNYFITNQKEHLITRSYIKKYKRPYVFMEGFPRKIEVVKEKLSAFERWLEDRADELI